VAHSFLSPCISLAISQPTHPSGAVGAPDDLLPVREWWSGAVGAPDDLLPLVFECVAHTGTEGGSMVVSRRSGGCKRQSSLFAKLNYALIKYNNPIC